MTHETESAMSSPVSISRVESMSDVDSVIGVGECSVPVPDMLGSPEDAVFASGDGDIRLIVDGTVLETHKYIIKRFSGLKDRIQNNAITLESDAPSPDDFRNMFKILYASVVEGPFVFDCLTLTSALRIATVYNYPALRAFAIKHLEKMPLSAVERIQLAREFELPTWEEPAYVELCQRDNAITKEEARILGLDAFIYIARIREKEQRRRGRVVDTATQEESKRQGEVHVTADPSTGISQGEDSESNSKLVEREQAKETPVETEQKEEDMLRPSFVNYRIKEAYHGPQGRKINLTVYGCACKRQYGPTPSEVEHCQCLLPPCAARAFQDLQIRQLCHKTSISSLESTMNQVQATLSSFTATCKPQMESSSGEDTQMGSIQEEVRKWLTGVESPARVA